jgi:hypothetical protein
LRAAFEQNDAWNSWVDESQMLQEISPGVRPRFIRTPCSTPSRLESLKRVAPHTPASALRIPDETEHH